MKCYDAIKNDLIFRIPLVARSIWTELQVVVYSGFNRAVARVSGEYEVSGAYGAFGKDGASEFPGKASGYPGNNLKNRIMQKLAFFSFAGIVLLLLAFTLQGPGGKKTSVSKEGSAYVHTASIATTSRPACQP